MSELQLIWFLLIGVLFSVFFFLEGFDFGVGMQFVTNARNKDEREALYASIGPSWDANEVWLIVGGGAMFASFPYWYASLFSGFYLMLFVVLLSLVFRAASFEFRDRVEKYMHVRHWERVIATASFLAPFFFGMIFTAMVKGMPIDANGDVHGTFLDFVNWYTLTGGVALSLASYIHGLNFIRMKVTGDMRTRALSQLKVLYPLMLAGEALFAVLTYVYTDFFDKKPVITTVLLGLIVVTTVISWIFANRKHEGISFISSGLVLAEIVTLIFTGLFPRVMVANNADMSILIKNASSSEYTLKVMFIVVLMFLPIALAYQIWSWIVFSRRFRVSKSK